MKQCIQCGKTLSGWTVGQKVMCVECHMSKFNKSNTNDVINSPSHYASDGIECIDYIRQVLGKEGFIAYCRGNAIKYQHRAGLKGSAKEDYQKAEKYLQYILNEI